MTEQAMPAGTWSGKHGPQVIAAVYSRAAALIDRYGYDGHRHSRVGAEPFSVSLAVETAAAQIFGEQQEELGAYDIDHVALAGSADQRLSGLLAFTGQAASGHSCQIDMWDGASPQHPKIETIAMLGQAAFMAGFVAGTARAVA